MWSGFFAAVLGGIAAIGSVVLGWFFNQYLKKASVKKALQLEIDANWQKLENIRKTSWPGRSLQDLDESAAQGGLENALNSHRVALAGWKSTVWNGSLVQIVAALRSRDLQRVQTFYGLLEELDRLSNGNETTEAVKVILQLLKGKKPEITGIR
jgi:hypothetical protein